MDLPLTTTDIENMTIEAREKTKDDLVESLRCFHTFEQRSDWHMAFEALLLLDMYDYGSKIKLLPEYELGVEPPRADYLVLKEDKVKLVKKIFTFFRQHNVIEYKRPDDSLNERILRKAVGYAFPTAKGLRSETLTSFGYAPSELGHVRLATA